MPCRGKPMNEHLSDEALAAFADGRLDAVSRRAAEAHLALCRECRRELTELVEILAGREATPDGFVGRALAMAGGGAAKRRPETRVTLLRPAFGVAAVFLVAVVAGYFFLGRGRVAVPPSGERALPEAAMQRKAERAPAEASPLKDATAARDEVPAKRDGAAPDWNLKKNAPGGGASGKEALAEAKGEEQQAAPTVLAEAPQAVPAAPERYQAADKREAAEAEAIADGAAGGVIGGLEQEQAQEKSRLASAPAPELRRRDFELPRPRGPADAGAVFGARQLFLAASGRAAAPPSLEMVELAAGPLVMVEGDVGRADVLPPGLRDASEWLPAGAAVEVTISAGGEVASVRLLGEWRPAAAARARAAAARLAFPPAAAPERRAVISRPRFN